MQGQSADFYKKTIESLFLIINKDMEEVPFVLNNPQNRMLKELENSTRDIILKARKEGISSLILAMFMVDFLTIENVRCVVISQEEEATKKLLGRAKFFLNSLKKTWPSDRPLPYSLKENSKKEMVNTKMNSTFYIGTAGGRAFGRGDDIHNLHISELPFWPNQESMMIGLVNSLTPNGRIIIEGTANGMGDYFHKLWLRARAGTSPYRSHFIPWFEDPTNVMPLVGLYKEMQLLDKEQELINAYHLTREQIAWRRWKINEGNGDFNDSQTWDTFNQENPATADEAFIVSGNPVFSPQALSFYFTRTKKPLITGYLRGFNPVSVEENDKGYLRVYKEPNEFHTYGIGVDVAEGKVTDEDAGSSNQRDASCAQVLDKTTYEQVAVWYGRVDADRLGREIDLLGRYYNDALIGVERNAMGIAPLVVLRDLGYPNLYYRERIGEMTDKITAELGWRTDAISKESLIADAVTLIRDKRLIIPDEDTLSEMRSFMRDPEGKAHASKSAFDDRVMAFMIAIRMIQKARVENMTNDIERPDTEAGGFWFQGQSFNDRGMPVHPDEMQDDNLYAGDEF